MDMIVSHFNFTAHAKAKRLEDVNRQLQDDLSAAKGHMVSTIKEKEQFEQQSIVLTRRCEKLTSSLTACAAEVESLKRELKYLRSEKENRKRKESQRFREMQSIKGRVAKRNSECSRVDSINSDDAIHDMFSDYKPLGDTGMRKRVLSFSFGMDTALSSIELERLRVENEQYRVRLRQLEEKVKYLKGELYAKNEGNIDFPLSPSEVKSDPQLLLVQNCLEEAIDDNMHLRKENEDLLSQLKSFKSGLVSDGNNTELKVDTTKCTVSTNTECVQCPVTTQSRDVKDICDLLSTCVSISKTSLQAPRKSDENKPPNVSTINAINLQSVSKPEE